MKTELKRWIKIDRRWKRKEDSLASPETTLNRASRMRPVGKCSQAEGRNILILSWLKRFLQRRRQSGTRHASRVNVCIHDTIGCQFGWQPVVSCIQTFNRLSNPFLTTVFTTGCVVYTNIQLVVKPVWQPVGQPVKPVGQPVGCLFTRYSTIPVSMVSIRLYNRFDNRLYRVNGV